ncbi:hypothetical protein KB559_22670 [Paenibacillus sp. Marseille-P2973]|uniref:hypothetical protein n=1 Tax=Paenibacillus sp. Marseille-P2973 TaxID=1871032 RepID=UPI001B395C18|nr:hypothetical protein [Paenibacillus sp. Marseille-P2973]MBQ4901646.1 hypothetical protein [Paenibacillus sp. Marseille-P2973]
MSRLSPLWGTLYVGAPAGLGSDFWRERATLCKEALSLWDALGFVRKMRGMHGCAMAAVPPGCAGFWRKECGEY